MKRYRTAIILAGLIVAASSLNLLGIGNEIPSPKVKNLLLPTKELSSLIIPRIVEVRESDKLYTDTLKKYEAMEIAGRYYMNLPENYLKEIGKEDKVYFLGEDSVGKLSLGSSSVGVSGSGLRSWEEGEACETFPKSSSI